MWKSLQVLTVIAALQSAGASAEIQGVIADWNCTREMVRDGREATLKHNRSCSLMKNYDRPGYGVITDDKKFYRLDDAGNRQARQLLSGTPDKDNLKVVVRGELDGNTIKVSNISLL
jgi:hypothetical protein